MSELTHYELRVIRLENLQSKSETPNLYVEVRLGDDVKKTKLVKKNKSPVWNDNLAFSSHDASTVLNVFVTERSRIRKHNRPICHVELTLAALLEECACGEAKLGLSPSSGKEMPTPAGLIYLYVKDVDAEKHGGIDIEGARRDIQRIKGSANAADSVGDKIASLVRKLDVVTEAIDGASTIHPYLNIAWQIASALYKVVSHQFKTDKELVDLVQLMEEIFEFARDAKTLTAKTRKITEGFDKVLGLTCECCRFVQHYTEHGFVGRMAKIDSNRKMVHYKEQFNTLKKALDSGITLNVSNMVDDIDTRQQLQILEKLLEPNKSDTSERPRCLPRTRAEYTQKIKDWLFLPTSENILWLSGIAGSGKSTIAATITDYCDDTSRLAAFLFFERGKNEYNSIIRTVAYQLASFDPTIARHVIDAVHQLKNVSGSLPARQFEKLLLGPLHASVGTVKGPIVIILDALDECGGVDQRREILELLRVQFSKLPLEFRFLITSRPENDIMRALSSKQHVLEIKLDSSSEQTRHDVDVYIKKEMYSAVGDPVPEDQTWDENMKVLSDAANGLFIWASTAVKVVSSCHDDPMGKLEDLVRDVRLGNKYDFGLDKLYDIVLEQSGISWSDAKARDRFMKVMGLILLGKEFFSDDVIDQFLDLEGKKSRLTLDLLRSVLAYEPGKPIHLHHTSFADYLLSSERSGKWFIDANIHKNMISARCFDVMDKLLHFNMCALQTSFIRNNEVQDLEGRVKDKVPPHLNYACRFWAEHLCELPYSPDSSNLLNKFMETHLLSWIEVLSLTKSVNRISSLSEATKWAATNNTSLSSFLWDAYRLVSMFTYPISQSTPHIYLSALSLTQGVSVVSDHYSRMRPTVRVHRVGSRAREKCIKVLKGDMDYVRSVAFSPDGKHVASGSDDCCVRIWDAESGEIVLAPLQKHTGYILSIAFSPDGKRLVSGSKDCTIRVWDTESGEVLPNTFYGHTGSVSSVVFSPDGKRIVSSSSDKSIRIWDAESGKVVAGPFEGHTGCVHSVAFSPDGKRIVSGSADRSVRIWNAESGEVVSGFEGHTDCVYSVSFSPDGKRLVSGSSDCLIRILDTESGKLVSDPLKGHADYVLSVAFSPDGKHIVSGAKDCSICIWDIVNGEVVSGPFKGHTDYVRSVAFSPDGKRIVSGSWDGSIRIWDAEREKNDSGPFEGHASYVRSVAFSPDGKHVASGSDDCSVRIWDAEGGKLVSDPFEGHTGCVRSVAFSPNGKRVVSGSDDCSIRIWIAQNGGMVADPFTGHTGCVRSVAFSPDGSLVVSGSDDCSIRVWDSKSGKLVSDPYKGHTAFVRSVAFSPNGKCIVSGSDDHSIRIWDVESGGLLSDLFIGHSGYVRAAVFSPDGKRIVSGSDDRSIRIWDVESRELVSRPLIGHSGSVYSVAFSPNGKLIVSSSNDCSIHVWDTESGKAGLAPFEGHTDYVYSVAFSLDGKHVVSGSRDCSIRIWDVESGKSKEELLEPRGEEMSLNASSLPAVHTDAGYPHRTIQPLSMGIGNMPSSLAALIGSKWNLSEDGWILGTQGELLIWIPDDRRATLWQARNTSVFSCPFSTRLDFTGCPLGEKWYKGFPSSLC